MRDLRSFVNFLRPLAPPTESDSFFRFLMENFDSQSKGPRGYGPAMNAPVRCEDDQLTLPGHGGRR